MKNKNLLIINSCALLLLLAVIMAFLPKPGSSYSSNPNDIFAKKRIIFIAGGCSHGPGEHEHNAGCTLLAAQLNKYLGKPVEAVVYQGWPTDTTVLDKAASIVLYMDGAEGHLALRHLEHLDALMQKGIGLACIHYAVEVPKNNGGPEFKRWLGGYFETFWSVSPHWEADYKNFPKHPVTNGIKPFTVDDEWYYHMRFRDDMKGVTPILTAIPPASTLSRKDGPRDNNEFVRKEQGTPQHMCWVTERQDGGRGFAFTGGHYHKNWRDENFRKLVLNGIAWTAKVAVPKNVIPAPALGDAELLVNFDQKPCARKR